MLTIWMIIFVLTTSGYWWLCRFTFKHQKNQIGFYFVLAGMLMGILVGSGGALFYLDMINRNHPLDLWFVMFAGAIVMIPGAFGSVVIYGYLLKKIKNQKISI